MRRLPVIGLEVHIELDTRSKMFCSCPNDPDENHPNVNVCPVCMGHPGTLPVANREAVKKVIKTGLALNCEISKKSKFDRKNYFYPDLPKGYQISQYDMPFCRGGYLKIEEKKIRITRVHLEEDTGKLVHPPKEGYSLVDFNRAGIPLMELVTEPDITSASQARQFAQGLQLILRYLNVSKADMEKGQMRVEANISLQEPGKGLGTKVEIKNLNSFRAVEKAVDYEIQRQAELLDSGKKVTQETRGWDDKKEETLSQREKEQAHDYRYFPEPDLPTISVPDNLIQEIKSEIPELPAERKERMMKEYGLTQESANIFTQNKDLGEYFEKAASELALQVEENFKEALKVSVNYITTDLLGLLKEAGVTGEDFRITPENFAEFISLIHNKVLSSKTAKQVLREMFQTGADPSHIIEERGLSLIADESEIENIIKDVISKNPKPVEDYKKGKESALQFLVGKVMAETQGRANPDIVHRHLEKLIS